MSPSAGAEWASGCLYHGGNVYYSPHEDGSTQNPTDGYICDNGAGSGDESLYIK